MGKAAKFKKLRKLASAMPVINTRAIIGVKMKGSELPKDVKIEGGKDIVMDGMYRQKKVIAAPINHNRKLKEAYKKNGMQGAASYAKAVATFVQSKQQAQ